MTEPTPTAPASTVFYSEEYYRTLVERFGYSTFDLQRFDFALAGMKHDELNLRYLCHHRANQFIATAPHRRIVTTGFGMSGPPHMASTSQIMKMVRLQQGGERCQIVLGDLDAYNGRTRSYGYTRELAERFRTFATRLGFDTATGVLRDQTGHAEALTTMYLLGRYAEDADFDTAEEDNHAYYAARGLVDPTMTFRRRLSLALMAADFVSLGQTHDAVLVLLGIDEHKYVRFAQRVAERFDQHVPLCGDFILSAIYTRLTTGFNGHPKSSKSIPGSGITVETPTNEIRRLVRADQAKNPALSPVYQLMYQMSYTSYEDLLDIHQACTEGTPRWKTEKEHFIEFLAHVKELWP
ncbi:hypothetical protein AB0I72_26900 [Nocardiopsis sp. NPDC049922]|uniref:hypothetical protein n=1 Tax=Nocardiopsis sp. NPDC049922 TaxID=3155157 RepID=UPI0033CA32FC